MSAAVAAASAAAMSQYTSRSSNSGGVSGPVISYNNVQNTMLRANSVMSRYESQKRRDWNTLGEYLRNHRPPLALARCSGAHVLEFLRYLDQFGKTKVHAESCPYFGVVHPEGPCACPLRQAWGSLDALVGRLRAAFEEHGGEPETNPFAARAVRLYLREVRDSQAKARGIAYDKKRKAKTTSNSNQVEEIGNVINRGRERERGRGATHCMLRACFRS